jgi:hypothetical protein
MLLLLLPLLPQGLPLPLPTLSMMGVLSISPSAALPM